VAQQRNGHNVFLRLPIFASLGRTRIDQTTETLDMEIYRHKRLRTISVLSLFLSTYLGVPQDRKKISCDVTQDSGEIRMFTGKVSTLKGAEFVEISLAHPSLGELQRHSHRVSDLLPAAARNPLFEALKLFCPESTIESMLTKAGTQSWKVDQSAAFEQHVSWLLSLLGFSPIALGKHEHLKSGKTQVGSIDIIARKGNILLLVACTLGAPKSEEYSALLHIQTLIANGFAGMSIVTVVPFDGDRNYKPGYLCKHRKRHESGSNPGHPSTDRNFEIDPNHWRRSVRKIFGGSPKYTD
jgi:hypothetical protein